MNANLANVQGLVTTLYRCKVSRHFLWSFASASGAQGFLRELLPLITNSQINVDAKPEPLVNLGLTFQGLQALDVAPDLLAQFDAMYVQGPNPVLLGDAPGSTSDLPLWWEGQFATTAIHATIHLYCQQDDTLESTTQQLRDIAAKYGVKELVPRHSGEVIEGRSLGGRKLHFGYMDGFSQPDVFWDDAQNAPGKLDFRNFVLGYGTDQIQSFPLKGAAAALVKDSSYAVFRWIYQDVAAFNQFLENNADAFPHLPKEEAQEYLAAKMMGRWRDGTPLVLSPDKPDETTLGDNSFSYATADPKGFKCPFSAHIRVVNPRDEPLDPVPSLEGVPRVLRRGTPYGPELVGSVDDKQDRGLVGIFICTDIRRQIYTLTNWIKQNSFSPVFNGNRRVQDPLMGNRKVAGTTADFLIQQPQGTSTIQGVPNFIRTKGTTFLLLPSLSMLHTLSNDNS